MSTSLSTPASYIPSPTGPVKTYDRQAEHMQLSTEPRLLILSALELAELSAAIGLAMLLPTDGERLARMGGIRLGILRVIQRLENSGAAGA